MRGNDKVILLKIVFIFCSIRSIVGDCVINLSPDVALRPSYYKYVGSNKLKVTTFSELSLFFDETKELEARCDINFEQPNYFREENILYIKCIGIGLHLSAGSQKRYYPNRLGYPPITCSAFKWNLYELSRNFVWCPSNMTSYELAKPKHSNTTESSFNYLAGICYDFNNLSFQSVYYKLTHKKTVHEQQFGDDFSYAFGLEIKYTDDLFSSNKISQNVFDDDQLTNWTTHLNYDFQSIIQHESLYSLFFDRFGFLLEFVWWPNLRLYNWKRYIDALEKHVEDDKKIYNILAGVSGTLKAPVIRSCEKNYTMEEVVLNKNRPIPLYVWNYLQDSANNTNELVIIGVNSPFHEFYSLDDIIFCTNKCQEISWLKEISHSFHYNTLGVIFCCSVEDVRNSKRLNGFPENAVKLDYVKLDNVPPPPPPPVAVDAEQWQPDENEYV